MNENLHKYCGEFISSGSSAKVRIPYRQLVEIIGPPHNDGPSFDKKVDVEWMLAVKDKPGMVLAFWNYCNGPAMSNGETKIEEVDLFTISFVRGDYAECEAYCRKLFGKGYRTAKEYMAELNEAYEASIA
jgi:hypothetical protein